MHTTLLTESTLNNPNTPFTLLLDEFEANAKHLGGIEIETSHPPFSRIADVATIKSILLRRYEEMDKKLREEKQEVREHEKGAKYMADLRKAGKNRARHGPHGI